MAFEGFYKILWVVTINKSVQTYPGYEAPESEGGTFAAQRFCDQLLQRDGLGGFGVRRFFGVLRFRAFRAFRAFRLLGVRVLLASVGFRVLGFGVEGSCVVQYHFYSFAGLLVFIHLKFLLLNSNTPCVSLIRKIELEPPEFQNISIPTVGN